MHSSIKLDSSVENAKSATLNWTADLLVAQNLTAQSLLVRIGGLDVPTDIDDADIYVPPFSSVTYSVNGTQFAFALGLPDVTPIPAGSPTTALITLSAGEPVPTFSGLPITSTSIAGTVDANITTPVQLAAGTEIALATGTEVALAAGTEVALAAGTEVTLPSGQEVALTSGTEVALASGTEVGLAAGTQVDTTGSTVGLESGTQVNSNIQNSVLPIGADASFVTTLTLTGSGSNSFLFSPVPSGVTAIAINSNALVNNYSIILLTAAGVANLVSESFRPQPVTRIIPLFNNGSNYSLFLQNNNGSTTKFDLWYVYGSFPVITTPIEGFTRTQMNLVSTGRSGYQANTAVSGTTTRFTIAAAATGQVLVLDGIFADSGANATSETAAFIRLQTNDVTPIILFELWSPDVVKTVIHEILPGPIYIPPGIAINCITNNGSSAAVLQTMTVLYHYQIQ